MQHPRELSFHGGSSFLKNWRTQLGTSTRYNNSTTTKRLTDETDTVRAHPRSGRTPCPLIAVRRGVRLLERIHVHYGTGTKTNSRVLTFLNLHTRGEVWGLNPALGDRWYVGCYRPRGFRVRKYLSKYRIYGHSSSRGMIKDKIG